MKRILKLLVFGVSLLGVTFAATSSYLQRNIPVLIKHRLPHALVGIAVINAKTGRTIFDYNDSHHFMPASNMKLFTASAALFYLKPTYRFHTTMNTAAAVKDGTLQGNLYIDFVGDPSFTIKDLKTMLLSLRHQGIRHINGNVMLDTAHFNSPNYAPGWTQNDVNWYYSAPITAVTLDENFVRFSLLPNYKIGSRTGYSRGPNAHFFGVTDRVRAATQQEAHGHCSLILNMNEKNHLYLGGCWPARKDPSVLQIAVKNPTLFAENIITNALKADGIGVTGKVEMGLLPSKTRVLVQHDSAPLASLLVTMLKHSDNFYAECLLKTMGYLYYHKGTFQEGVQAMKEILSKHTTINFSKTKLFDGSGQSYYDHVTPRQLVTLLYDVRHSSIYSYLYRGLPISGRDGTLAYRMGRKPLLGRVHAKTGTLQGGASSLSGYLYDAGGQQLIFSIIVNNIAGEIRSARAFQDAAVALFYQI